MSERRPPSRQFAPVFQFHDVELKSITEEDTRDMPVPPSIEGQKQTDQLDMEETLSLAAIEVQRNSTVAPPPGPFHSQNSLYGAGWQSETFGFDINDKPAFDLDDIPRFDSDDDPEFDKLATIPMMVLKGIAKQQSQQVPVMKSEVSGAAGAAAIVGVGNIAATVFKYATTFIIQRGFGIHLFALYSIGLSLVTLISSIFNLGLDDAMVRYVSIYRGKQQTHLLRGLVLFCTIMVGIMGILGACLVLALAPIFPASKKYPDLIPLLQIMAPLVPLMCMQVIWSGGLQGFKSFKWRVLSQRIIPSLIQILLLIFLYFTMRDFIGIALAALISTVISVILGLYFFFRHVSHIVSPVSEEYALREWLGFATPNFLTTIVDTVLESADTLLLTFFAIADVGIGQYSASLKISTFIAVPLLSLNAMFSPTIAELHSKGETEKLTSMFKTVTKWSVTFSLPIFSIATLFSVQLLALSGDKFVPGWPLLIGLSMGSMVNAGTGSVGNMLLMTGHQKLSFLNSLVAVVVNVVLGIILIPLFGVIGVAISTGLAYVTVNLMRILQVRLLLKIQPYSRDVLKPIGAAVISGLLTGGLLYLMNIAHITMQFVHAISIQLILVPVFLACYAGLLYMFKLSPEDQIVVDAFRRKLGRGKKRRKK